MLARIFAYGARYRTLPLLIRIDVASFHSARAELHAPRTIFARSDASETRLGRIPARQVKTLRTHLDRECEHHDYSECTT